MKNLLLLSIVFFFSCSAEKKIIKRQKLKDEICATCPVKETKVDSTWYKEYVNYRDSVLNVPKDSANLKLKVYPCPDGTIPKVEQTYKRDGRKTTIDVNVDDKGNIDINANVGAEQLKFELREKIKEYNKKIKEIKTLPCEEKWGEDFFYYSGIVAYILAALTLSIALIWYSINKRKKESKTN